MGEKVRLKDLIGGLASEDVKFLYWCWENKEYLNKIRIKARPGKAITNSNSSGDIRNVKVFNPVDEKIDKTGLV